jgi:hypothetical protein
MRFNASRVAAVRRLAYGIRVFTIALRGACTVHTRGIRS